MFAYYYQGTCLFQERNRDVVLARWVRLREFRSHCKVTVLWISDPETSTIVVNFVSFHISQPTQVTIANIFCKKFKSFFEIPNKIRSNKIFPKFFRNKSKRLAQEWNEDNTTGSILQVFPLSILLPWRLNLRTIEYSLNAEEFFIQFPGILPAFIFLPLKSLNVPVFFHSTN